MPVDARQSRPNTRRGVAGKEVGLDVVVEVQLVEAGQGLGCGEHEVVGAEQHLVAASPGKMVDELGRISVGGVGAGVDEDVWVLVGQRDHLGRPRIPDVPADDAELGKSSATWSMEEIGRPVSLGRNGPVCVISSGIASSSRSGRPIQRLSESNISCLEWRSVGCCIHTSMTDREKPMIRALARTP